MKVENFKYFCFDDEKKRKKQDFGSFFILMFFIIKNMFFYGKKRLIFYPAAALQFTQHAAHRNILSVAYQESNTMDRVRWILVLDNSNFTSWRAGLILARNK